MSKKFLFGFVLGLIFVVAAVLWLLSIVAEDTFGWFTLGWAVTLIAGGFGIAFILRGLFSKTAGPIKKFYIYFGAGMLVMAVLALVGELSMPGKIVLPIIAIILTAALLLGFIAVGGKKWDQGDNQNVGYKNYYQRKAEEEAKNKDKKDGE